jgi:hypothetical protein
MKADKLENKKLKKDQSPSLSDYLNYFICDAKKIILFFLQSFSLSHPFLFNEENLQDSFWTYVVSKPKQGNLSGTKVAFLEEPQRGLAGSRMEAIFLENRLI